MANFQRRQTVVLAMLVPDTGGPSRRQSTPGPSSPPPPYSQTKSEATTSTLKALKRGYYTTSDGKRHDIDTANRQLFSATTYFQPDDETLRSWRTGTPKKTVKGSEVATDIQFRQQSTISTAREWAWAINDKPGQQVGVLNCGSPVQPGGGFELQGIKNQENSIARATNLIISLRSPVGQEFYSSQEKATRKGGLWTDGIIYSRGVTIVKDSRGHWVEPLTVDIVTASPVDAGQVRSTLGARYPAERVTKLIEDTMEERMGRILRVFEKRGNKVLVLAAFGAGESKNKNASIARTWARLLGPGGRFQGRFTDIAFAIRDDQPFKEFGEAFRDEIRLRDILASM